MPKSQERIDKEKRRKELRLYGEDNECHTKHDLFWFNQNVKSGITEEQSIESLRKCVENAHKNKYE
jgi:hypothetical protein